MICTLTRPKWKVLQFAPSQSGKMTDSTLKLIRSPRFNSVHFLPRCDCHVCFGLEDWCIRHRVDEHICSMHWSGICGEIRAISGTLIMSLVIQQNKKATVPWIPRKCDYKIPYQHVQASLLAAINMCARIHFDWLYFLIVQLACPVGTHTYTSVVGNILPLCTVLRTTLWKCCRLSKHVAL